MNLESLVLELVADDSKLSRDIDAAVSKATKKLAAIEKVGAISPSVDLDSLHELNKVLDSKQRHLTDTVRFFKSNKIKVFVDKDEIDEAKEALKELREERNKSEFSSQPSNSKNRQSSKDGYEPGTLFNEVEQKLTGEIKKVVSKVGDIATAPLAGIGRGFFEGFGQVISKELSEGFLGVLSSDLNVNLKGMGKKAADATIDYAFPTVKDKKAQKARVKQYQDQMQEVDELIDSISRVASSSGGLSQEKDSIGKLKSQSKKIKENLKAVESSIGSKGLPSNADVLAMGQQVNSQIDAIAKLSATLNAVSGAVGKKLTQYRESEKLVSELSSRLDMAVNTNDYQAVRQVKNDISKQIKNLGDVEGDTVLMGYRDQLIQYQKSARLDSRLIAKTSDKPGIRDYLMHPKTSMELMAEKGKIAMGDVGNAVKNELGGVLVEGAKLGARGVVGAGRGLYNAADTLESMALMGPAKHIIKPIAVAAGLPLLGAVAPQIAPVAHAMQSVGGMGGGMLAGSLDASLAGLQAIPVVGTQLTAVITQGVTAIGGFVAEVLAAGVAINTLSGGVNKLTSNSPLTKAIAPSENQPKTLQAAQGVVNQAQKYTSKLIEKAQNIDVYLPTLPENQRKLIGEYLPKAANIERANRGDFIPQSVNLPGLKAIAPADYKKLDSTMQSAIESDFVMQYKAAQKVMFEFMAKMRGSIDPLDRMKGDIASLSSAFKAQVKRLEKQGKDLGFDVKKYKMDESAFKGVTLDADAVEMPDISKMKRSADDIGKSIPEGVDQGVKANQAMALQSIEVMMEEGVNVAKKAIGSNSPSKIYAEQVGKPIGQGVEKGAKESLQKAAKTIQSEVEKLESQLRENPSAVSSDDIESAYNKGVIDLIGEGSFGKVYKAGNTAVKIGEIGDNEIDMQSRMADYGFAPKVYGELASGDGFVMDLINSFRPLSDVVDITENQFNQLIKALKTMIDSDIVHGDLQALNVGYSKDGKGDLQIIDFGMASTINDAYEPNDLEKIYLNALENIDLSNVDKEGKIPELAQRRWKPSNLDNLSKEYGLINNDIEQNWEKTKKSVQADIVEITQTAQDQSYDLTRFLSEGSPGPTEYIRQNWEKTAKFVNKQIESITANSAKLFAKGDNQAGRMGIDYNQFPIPPDPISEAKERQAHFEWLQQQTNQDETRLMSRTFEPPSNATGDVRRRRGDYDVNQKELSLNPWEYKGYNRPRFNAGARKELINNINSATSQNELEVLRRDVVHTINKLKDVKQKINESISKVGGNPSSRQQNILNRIEKEIENINKTFSRKFGELGAGTGEIVVEGTEEFYDNFFDNIKQSLVKKLNLKGDMGENLIDQIMTFAVAGASTFAPGLAPAVAAAPLFMPLVPGAIASVAVSSLVAPIVQRIDQALLQQEPIKQRFTTLEGNPVLGQAKQQQITDIANKYSIPVEPAVQNFSQMAIAAQNTNLTAQEMIDLFEGISASIRALGLSTQDADLIFMAYTQMLAKGKVSMEELRQQLGERFPPAMSVFAKALNTTTAGLDEMVSRGAIGTEKWVSSVTKILKEDFGTAALAMGDNYMAASSRLENINFKINKNFADTYGGLFTFIKNTWGGILNFLADNFQILNALAVSGLIAVWASIGIGISYIMKTPAIANMAKGGSNLLFSVFKNSLGTLTPFLVGVLADVMDDIFNTENNLMENMSKGVTNMFVAAFGGVDRVMHDNDMGALFDPYITRGNPFQSIIDGISKLVNAIPSGLIEMTSLILMFEQVRVLGNMFVVPTFQSMGTAIVRWGKSVKDAVLNAKTMNRTVGDLFGGTLIALGGVSKDDALKQFSGEFGTLRKGLDADLDMLNQYKQKREAIIKGYQQDYMRATGSPISREKAIADNQQQLRELKRQYSQQREALMGEGDFANKMSPERDALVRYQTKRDELLNRRMKKMAAQRLAIGGAMIAAEAGIAVAMMSFARSDFSNTIEAESNKARTTFIGSVDAMKAALKTLESQGAETAKTLSTIKLPSKGLELNPEAIFLGRSEKSFKSDDLILKNREELKKLADEYERLVKLSKNTGNPFLRVWAELTKPLARETQQSRIDASQRLGVADYYPQQTGITPTIAEDQFLDTLLGFEQEYKNIVNKLAKNNNVFDINDLSKPLTANALNAVKQVQDIDAKMKSKQNKRSILGLEDTAESRSEIRKIDKELNDLLKTRKELAKPFVDLDSFSKDLDNLVASQTSAIKNSGLPSAAQRAALEQLEPIKQLAENIKSYFAGQGITDIAKPLEDAWDRIVNKIQDVESALNRVKAVNAVELSNTNVGIYDQGGGNLIVNRRVQEAALEGAKKDYEILAKTLRQNEQALAEALSISNVGDSSEKRSKIEELRSRVQDQSVELANAASSIAKARYDLSKDFALEDYFRNTSRQIEDLNFQIESQQIQDQRSLQDLSFQLQDASVSLRRSNRALGEAYQDMAFDFNVQVATVGKAINDAQDQLELTQLRINNLSVTPGNSGSIARQIDDILLRYSESVFGTQSNERQIKIDILNLEKERIQRLRQIRDFEERQMDATRDFARQIITLQRAFFDLERNMKQSAMGFIRQIQDMTREMARNDNSSSRAIELRNQLQAVPQYNPRMVLPNPTGQSVRAIDSITSERNRVQTQVDQSRPVINYAPGDPNILKDAMERYNGFPANQSKTLINSLQSSLNFPINSGQIELAQTAQLGGWIERTLNGVGHWVEGITNKKPKNLPELARQFAREQEKYSWELNSKSLFQLFGVDPVAAARQLSIGTFDAIPGMQKQFNQYAKDRGFPTPSLPPVVPPAISNPNSAEFKRRQANPPSNRTRPQQVSQPVSNPASVAVPMAQRLNLAKHYSRFYSQSHSLNLSPKQLESMAKALAEYRSSDKKLQQQFERYVNLSDAERRAVVVEMQKIEQQNKVAQERVKQNNQTRRLGSQSILNGKPVYWAGEDWEWQSEESYRKLLRNNFQRPAPPTIKAQATITQASQTQSVNPDNIVSQTQVVYSPLPRQDVPFIYQESAPLPQDYNPYGYYESVQDTFIGNYDFQAPSVYPIQPLLNQAATLENMNDTLIELRNKGVKAEALLNFVEMNDSLNQLINGLDDAKQSSVRNVEDTTLSVNQLVESSKGWLTITQKINRVGSDTFTQYENQIRTLSDTIRDKERLLQNSGSSLIKLEAEIEKAVAMGFDSSNLKAQKQKLAILIDSERQNKESLQTLLNQVTATQNIAVANAKNNAYLQEQLNYLDKMSSLAASISSAQYDLGGSLINEAPILQARIAMATAEQRAFLQGRADGLDGQALTEYVDMSKELASINYKKSFSDAIPFVKELGANLKEAVFETNNFTEAFSKLFNVMASDIFDRLVLMPLTNMASQWLGETFNLGSQKIPTLTGSLAVGNEIVNNPMVNDDGQVKFEPFNQAIETVAQTSQSYGSELANLTTLTTTQVVTEQAALNQFIAALQVATQALYQFAVTASSGGASSGLGGVFGTIGKAVGGLFSGGVSSLAGDFMPGNVIGVDSSISLPAFANGLTEQRMTGRKPMLAIVNEGEAILSTLNGDAQKFQALKRSGTWDKMPNFANGVDRLYNDSRNYRGNWSMEAMLPSTQTSQTINNQRSQVVNQFSQNYTIVTPNADSFRKSQAQIQDEGARTYRRKMR